MSKVLLLFPNHPGYYPHVARHVQALKGLYSEVIVGAVFKIGDPLPQIQGLQYYSLAQEFPAGVMGFVRFMVAVRKLILHLKPDAIEAVDPPCLIPAAELSKQLSFKLVYFSMELFTDTPALVHKPIKRSVWGILEKYAVQKAHKVLTVNASVAQALRQKFSLAQVGVVRSMPFRSPWRPKDPWMRKKFAIAPDQFALVYQGHLEPGRGIEKFVELLPQRPSVHLVVMGLGPLADWVKAQAEVVPNLHFAGAFPFDELMVKASGADAGLVWIEPFSESYRISLPGKIFEYVQNELPVLGSPLPEIRTHITVGEVGEVASGFSDMAILKALDTLCVNSKAKVYAPGLQRARNEWCWEQEQIHLRRAFQDQ